MGTEERGGTTVDLAREEGFRFRVRFGTDRIPVLHTDEPPPIGGGTGPNPTALLAAAIGNCLASSLLFCATKARVEVADLTADVEVRLVRNPEGRLRIGGVEVRLEPALSPDGPARLARCVELFESFCTVTESVRHGIAVNVAVEPRMAADAHGAAGDPPPRSPVADG